MSTRVAIIMLHWGDPAITADALASLKKVTAPEYKIFLVDQTKALDIPLDKTTTQLIVPAKNLGFAGGNNLGIKQALTEDFDYILLLNNDVLVEPDFLSHLVDALENDPKAAAAGPLITYYEPAADVWYAGGEMSRKTGNVAHLGLRQSVQTVDRSHIQSVSFITGCSLLLRASVVAEIGGLDDSFFMYSEDVDWCARAQDAGYTLLYVPAAHVIHRISSSFSVNSPTYLYYVMRNNWYTIRRYTPWYWKPLAWGWMGYKYARETAKIFLRYKQHYRQYFYLLWRAYYDNLRRRYGQL